MAGQEQGSALLLLTKEANYVQITNQYRDAKRAIDNIFRSTLGSEYTPREPSVLIAGDESYSAFINESIDCAERNAGMELTKEETNPMRLAPMAYIPESNVILIPEKTVAYAKSSPLAALHIQMTLFEEYMHAATTVLDTETGALRTGFVEDVGDNSPILLPGKLYAAEAIPSELLFRRGRSRGAGGIREAAGEEANVLTERATKLAVMLMISKTAYKDLYKKLLITSGEKIFGVFIDDTFLLKTLITALFKNDRSLLHNEFTDRRTNTKIRILDILQKGCAFFAFRDPQTGRKEEDLFSYTDFIIGR